MFHLKHIHFHHLAYSCGPTCIYGRRSFSCAGPVLWNSLPEDMLLLHYIHHANNVLFLFCNDINQCYNSVEKL